MSLTGDGPEATSTEAPEREREKDHDPSSPITCRDLTVLKQEILAEMRRELQKVKSELIDGLLAHLLHSLLVQLYFVFSNLFYI